MIQKKFTTRAAAFLIGCISLSTVVGTGQTDNGQPPTISPNVRLRATRGSKSAQADEQKKTKRIEENTSVEGATNARDAAEKYLQTKASELGIAPIVNSKGASSLRVVDEKISLTGTHLTYRQFVNNLPVFNEQLKVSVNKSLEVTQVSSDVAPVGTGKGDFDTKLGNEAEAIKAAVAAVNAKTEPVSPPKAEAGIVTSKSAGAATVYRVTFTTKNPGAAWVVFVDGKTNKVLSVKNVARYLTGKGMVFRPNPIVSSGLTTFQDNDDADSPALNKQLISVILQDLDKSGTLSGTYATTAPTNTFVRAKSKTRTFNYTRSDDRFEEVMAYHYVTEATRYVKLIGFDIKSIFGGRAIPIDVNFEDIENAFFNPLEKQLSFGSGGVDTAEDATVIVHEFGHALLDHQAPTFDPGDGYTEGGAIHEGFGDYMAASFFAGSGFQKGIWTPYIGSWFAAGIPELNTGKPPRLRSMSSTKIYPKDLDPDGEPHANGEIWAATLWDIYKKLGKKQSDTIIIESNFLLSGQAGFADAANNIIAVDKELYKGVNQTALRAIFVKRGILK